MVKLLMMLLKGLGQHAQQWEPIIRTLAAYLPDIKWVVPQRYAYLTQRPHVNPHRFVAPLYL